jgi:carboxypeptidase Taq
MSRRDYEQLIDHVRQTSLLSSTAQLLGWDQQVMMPRGGVEYRSRQMGMMAGLIHERSTDPRVGQWLAACEADGELTADPSGDAAVNVRELRRSFDQATKLPCDLVEAFARTGALSRAAWEEARRENDFSRFRPWLERMIELCRRKASCLGWQQGGEPWDALGDLYEPGVTAADVEALFTPLRPRLKRLKDEILGRRGSPRSAFDRMVFPAEPWRRFVQFVAEKLGFDFDRGRLDTAAHPFCCGFEPNDVRLTTRFDEQNPIEPLFSTMHETGHGIYNQGLPVEHVGTPLGSAVSHAIHESQSRLWENLVGRRASFWTWCLPHMKKACGGAVAELSVDQALDAVNLVRPGMIRVEADEVTYNLHIMVRFDLERALLAGDLAVADLPEAWKNKYAALLGVDVPDDARGCLQDIHWSQGALGYFPSYAMGNLYAAQFYEKAAEEMGDLDAQFSAGSFEPLRQWLAQAIHRHGMRYRAPELCERVTGRTLSPEPFVASLEARLGG